MEPDDDFCCGHADAGPVGTYVRVAAAEGGHCGPTRPKFQQHPLRQENGDLKPRSCDPVRLPSANAGTGLPHDEPTPPDR